MVRISKYSCKGSADQGRQRAATHEPGLRLLLSIPRSNSMHTAQPSIWLQLTYEKSSMHMSTLAVHAAPDLHYLEPSRNRRHAEAAEMASQGVHCIAAGGGPGASHL